MKIFAVIIFLFLSACKPDAMFIWEPQYDVYMAEKGFTLDETRTIISKNGIKIVEFSDCYRCWNDILVPTEIFYKVQTSFLDTHENAVIQYNQDLMKKMDLTE